MAGQFGRDFFCAMVFDVLQGVDPHPRQRLRRTRVLLDEIGRNIEAARRPGAAEHVMCALFGPRVVDHVAVATLLDGRGGRLDSNQGVDNSVLERRDCRAAAADSHSLCRRRIQAIFLEQEFDHLLGRRASRGNPDLEIRQVFDGLGLGVRLAGKHDQAGIQIAGHDHFD